jgi:hypothetical protein
VDSGPNALAVTAAGNAQVSTTQSKYGGASGYFDGSGDYLDTSGTGIATAFGTGDFTIEFWYYPLTVSVQQNLVDKIGSASNAIYMSSAGVLKYYVGADRITGSTLSANTWYHIALVRYSGTTKLYVNGVQSGASYADTNNYALNTGSPRIGAAFNNTVSVNGYIDDFRISRFARYVSNFTPPTAALPTAASSTVADPYYNYTSLLLHMDGTNTSTNFVDSGPNAFTLTRYGTAAVSTTQSKYGGASAYFDGSGAKLGLNSTAIDFGTGDFTAECWLYLISTPTGAYAHVMGKQVGGVSASWILYLNTSRVLLFGWNNTNQSIQSPSALNLSQWYHLAISRTGSTIRMFIDGTQVASTTISYTFSSSTEFTVGAASNDYTPARLNAYIDDLRITKYARYTSAFAPPTTAFPNA